MPQNRGPPGVRIYDFSLKILISTFILFHWFCVMAWLMPKPSAIRTALFSIQVPFIKSSSPLVNSYLYHTSMEQSWMMFAPNPVQRNSYLNATVYFKDGSHKELQFSRLSQMNFMQAWMQKRYQKFQASVLSKKRPIFLKYFACYMAQTMNTDLHNPPVRVVINQIIAFIPRHDRPELKEANAPQRIDYTKLLREDMKDSTTLMIDYSVMPEDLRNSANPLSTPECTIPN